MKTEYMKDVKAKFMLKLLIKQMANWVMVRQRSHVLQILKKEQARKPRSYDSSKLQTMTCKHTEGQGKRLRENRNSYSSGQCEYWSYSAVVE